MDKMDRPRSFAARLEQGEFWWTKDGRTIRVEDMDDDHRYNLRRFLWERVEYLRFRWEMRVMLGFPEDPSDGLVGLIESMENEWEDTPDKEWFESRPLVKALRDTTRGDGVLTTPERSG